MPNGPQPDSPQPREVGYRVEQLLTELRAVSDPATRDKAEELVRLLVELYGAGLERTMEIVAGSSAGGEELIDRLADDELVASLLILHGLHPLGVVERVRRALDRVRPYLGSHAGDVELLGVDEAGVVRLALRGSCDGCASSAVTVKLAIERAIEEAAPEVTSVQVAGVTEHRRAEPTLLTIQPRPPDAAPAPPDAEWLPVPGLADLAAGEPAPVEVAGLRLVVCRLGESLYAYRDRCGDCGSSLAGGQLRGELLSCPSCRRRYHVRLAGRADDAGADGPHLDPLPLLVHAGEVKVAVPAVGVGS
jgi:Fe-S cluster biogenesis protein NfuA/nitrite reductase/ring-hydroxylating ferredoxin subunit